LRIVHYGQEMRSVSQFMRRPLAEETSCFGNIKTEAMEMAAILPG
jgi:hypothetical protein